MCEQLAKRSVRKGSSVNRDGRGNECTAYNASDGTLECLYCLKISSAEWDRGSNVRERQSNDR